MAVYTVHEPPARSGETAPDPSRAVFVRDGFYFWAFLLGPFWMLWRRLWLVFFLYLALMILLRVGLSLLQVSAPGQFLIGVAISLLVGLEAASLQRFTLARRRYKERGVVIGDDLEAAERHFFADTPARLDRVAAAQAAAPNPPAPAGMPYAPSASGGIIGLFPEPGARS